MSWLDALEYSLLDRAKGMRLPPRMATLRGEEEVMSVITPSSFVWSVPCLAASLPVGVAPDAVSGGCGTLVVPVTELQDSVPGHTLGYE